MDATAIWDQVDMPTATTADNRRQTSRAETNLAVTIRVGERRYQGEIVDLSKRGAKVRTDAALQEGDAVNLSIQLLGRYEGTVAWRDEGLLGIKFADECLLLVLISGGWCGLPA